MWSPPEEDMQEPMDDLSQLAPMLGITDPGQIAALRMVPRSAVAGLMTTLRPQREPQRAPVPGVDEPFSPEVEAQRRRLRPPAQLIPGRDVPLSPEVEEQRRRMAASTAAQKGDGPNQVETIMKGVADLTAKINKSEGLWAKVTGAYKSAAGAMNLDPDVAEYESLIQGATPFIARRMGHTGVLTQQDVDSVRAMFPKTGDSRTVRDRKIARVFSILGLPIPEGLSSEGADQPIVGEIRWTKDGRKGRWDGVGWELVE